MKLRKTQNGRVKDIDSGVFVSKKLVKSIMHGKPVKALKPKKSTKRHKKINHPKQRATNIITIRQYRDGTFSADFGHKNVSDTDLLYFGEFFKQMAEKKINIDINKYVNPSAWK